MPTEAPGTESQPGVEIDRIIHEPARLLVLAQLFETESADFLYLLRHTGLTKGNLSAHLRKLEQAGYVEVEKTFVERLPLTVVRLSEKGREAIEAYRRQMLELLGTFKTEA
jgi:DNA-binding MarR family transcriptional regulator